MWSGIYRFGIEICKREFGSNAKTHCNQRQLPPRQFQPVKQGVQLRLFRAGYAQLKAPPLALPVAFLPQCHLVHLLSGSVACLRVE